MANVANGVTSEISAISEKHRNGSAKKNESGG